MKSQTVNRTRMGVQPRTSLIPMAEASNGVYVNYIHLGTRDTELNLHADPDIP